MQRACAATARDGRAALVALPRTPRQRATASLVEGTAGKQSGAKGRSAETAERNPEPNLELHLSRPRDRSTSSSSIGIWDTVRL